MKKEFIRKVLLGLFLGFTMTSCILNDAETNLLPDPSVSGETGYFSLTLDYSSTGTRASDEDEGIKPEYSVDSIRVVLYKAKDGIAAYSFNMDATNNGGNSFFEGADVKTVTSAGSRRFTSKAKEVDVDDYYLLVILNYPPEVEVVTREGAHFDQFGNAIYNLGNDYSKLIGVADPRYKESNNQHYSFFMSNFKKDILIEGKRVLYENEEKAEEKPVNVIVDRAVAKVTVKQNNLEVENGTVEDIRWKLDITNKQTYWVRHAALTAEGDWETQRETNRTILYAKDPNFDNISSKRNPALVTSPATYFNYISDADLINDNCEWEYVTENTMEAEEQWEDVTTRLVIRANFIPNGFIAGDSYYWWRGHAFTPDEIKAYAADIESIPEVFNGLEEILFSLTNAGYDFDNPTPINHPAIEFYKNGISYFTTYIRHFNDEYAPGKMQYGRYGIVRNNQYTMNLKKISGPGKPVIPPPGKKVDEDPQYLSVDIQIQNWYSRDTQDIKE